MMDCVPAASAGVLTINLLDAAGGMYAELSRIQTVVDSLPSGADRDAAQRITSTITAQLDLLLDWLAEAPLEAVRH